MFLLRTVLPRRIIAILTAFLGCASLHAQAQSVPSCTIVPTHNPANANPPNSMITAGSVGLNTDYTLQVEGNTYDPTYFVASVSLYGYQKSYYTNWQYVATNNGQPKYTAYATTSVSDFYHAWTCVNQAYGQYGWSGKANFNDDSAKSTANIYGSYDS